MDDSGPTDTEQLVARARRLAVGLADTGLTQAEEMMRRVSPEGRARARRAAAERARRRNAVIGRIVMVALAATLAVYLIGMLTPFGGIALPIGVAAVIAAAVFFIARGGTHAATPVRLAMADLAQLPGQTARWLETQHLALPAPAVRLADQLQQRLDGLAPQLAQLGADEPAADAVRKLLATELPQLVEGYHAVPPALRDQPRADGSTADAHLLDGLRLIDGEVARMTEQLARGAVDEVATQGRYLELKYKGEGGLG